jgi:DNA polymerase-1
MRRIATTINFGVMYGMSSFGLAQSLKISRTKAQDFKTKYEQMYSGVTDFFNTTIGKCAETGYVETIFGRRRSITQINSRNKTEKSAAERIAKNTPIQGSAADIVKQAMINVYGALKKTYPTAKMLLQVHDEIIVECDSKDTEGVSKIMQSEMENVIKLKVPLKVSVESGQRWGEFH